MSRMDDAAIREAMAPRAWSSPADRERMHALAAEALARGSEVEGLRAEVERLTRERDELAVFRSEGHAETCDGIDEAEGRCACRYLQRQGGHAALVAAWEIQRGLDEEVARLRAAALPEDAEERIARTCFEWDRGATWDERTNSDVENYTDQARAVLAALRGDA